MNQKNHPLYGTWSNMLTRCHNPNGTSYPWYGARGIRVCDRWRSSFWNFVEDMGEKPTPEHTIDRIDNDGNYSPENCRWATRVEQQANTRRPIRGASNPASRVSRDLKVYKCSDCETEISPSAKRCRSCADKSRERIQWVDTSDLIRMVEESNFTQVAKQLGVSDNAIRKRIKNH